MGCCGGDHLTKDQVNTVVNGVKVDYLGRSKLFTPLRADRPWFRGFHFATWSFFIVFLQWFFIVPALPYLIQEDNDIDEEVVKTSNIVSVLGTIFLRLLIGPLLEIFGPRRLQTILLSFGSVMCMLAATVNTAAGLIAIRFAISFVGAGFVPCQFWCIMLFSGEIVGQANAFAGGWGNLGGGAANIFSGALIKGLKQTYDPFVAWRIAMVIPGIIGLVFSAFMFVYSDDCPQGHWNDRLYGRVADPADADQDDTEKNLSVPLKKKYVTPGSKITKNPKIEPWVDWRVWILFLQYAACFGIELTINNSMQGYLYKRFVVDDANCTNPYKVNAAGTKVFKEECSVLGIDNASMIAGLFGLMNIFARALGGLFSDFLNRKFYMRGRLTCQFICLLGEGIMLIIFSRMTTVASAIVMLIAFSTFVQASEGSTFALVPFMCKVIGPVAGIVGAGGNVGAVIWSTILKKTNNATGDTYLMLGYIVLASAFLTLLLPVQGTFMTCGENPSTMNDDDNVSEAGSEDISMHGIAMNYEPEEISLHKSAENVNIPPKTSVTQA